MALKKINKIVFIPENKKRLIVICLAGFLLVASEIIFLYNFDFFSQLANQDPISRGDIGGLNCLPETAGGSCVRRLLDGVYVRNGQESLTPVAVVIENHPDSRPPAGLAQAKLVYEAEAEGGITRFLAVFDSGEKISSIGPIRSVRPYFVDWAEELSALLVHCGGSPDALARITRDRTSDLNEFYNGSYFWRDSNRPTPHNVYTSSDQLARFLKETDVKSGDFFSWQYKEDLPLEARPKETAEISIFYKAPDFLVKWVYNPQTNGYRRYQAGDIHTDQEGKVITAKNIVIEYVNAEVIDKDLRLKMATTGLGKAIICLDGSCQEGSWRKPDAASRSYLYDSNSMEIKFNSGITWIEVVRQNTEAKYN